MKYYFTVSGNEVSTAQSLQRCLLSKKELISQVEQQFVMVLPVHTSRIEESVWGRTENPVRRQEGADVPMQKILLFFCFCFFCQPSSAKMFEFHTPNVSWAGSMCNRFPPYLKIYKTTLLIQCRNCMVCHTNVSYNKTLHYQHMLSFFQINNPLAQTSASHSLPNIPSFLSPSRRPRNPICTYRHKRFLPLRGFQ